jgi:hypothetical protein
VLIEQGVHVREYCGRLTGHAWQSHAGKRRVLLGGLIHDYYALAT